MLRISPTRTFPHLVLPWLLGLPVVATFSVAASFAGCQAVERVNDVKSGTDTETESASDETCEPGAVSCEDKGVVTCDADGTWTETTDCSAIGESCADGTCLDMSAECAAAVASDSYIGCEYFATTLANTQLKTDNFTFAVAIASENDVAVTVRIDNGPGGTVDNTYTVPPHDMLTIEDLPWRQNLVHTETFDAKTNTMRYASRKVANGAYHIVSSLPVSAYQFNALEYEAAGSTFSNTNDASLLLPAHIYGNEYIAVARPTRESYYTYGDKGFVSSPGFLAVIGRAEGTSVVEIESTAYTTASDALSNIDIAPLAPGGTVTVELAPYEVLQILSGADSDCEAVANPETRSDFEFCDAPATYDLTGTKIRVVSGPAPAVFSGHDCANLPFNVMACDHLEEQIFPLETWGTHFVVGQNAVQAEGEKTIWRIVSGADDNEIRFGSETAEPSYTLNKGEFVELELYGGFEAFGKDKLAIAQFLVGLDYTYAILNDPPENGDPSMALAVPVEQYRTSYLFLAPKTYVLNYVTAVHATGKVPLLDSAPMAGETLSFFDSSGNWEQTTVKIDGGSHFMESDTPFAATVYGFGFCTSYMYPAGLDMKTIVVL